jgi:ribosomal protein L21E
MVTSPRLGQRVRIHYASSYAQSMPHHGKRGVVAIVCHGRPRNHGVALDDGTFVVVPAGNLQPEREVGDA